MINDTLISYPITSLSGEIDIPGDKSISHRAVLLGAIASGVTTVKGFLNGDDCLATISALQAMNVSIQQSASDVTIQGVGKYGLEKPEHAIDCGNSGTSMRLLSGLLAAQRFDSELIGDASLLKRPMARVSDPLNLMGAKVTTYNGCAPIYIKGGQTLHGIDYVMKQASAQVKSALLLAGLYAENITKIHEPQCTRDHTERMLNAFSYPIHQSNQTVEIGSLHSLAATHIQVPGDLSSAAYFIVAACLTPNANLVLKWVGINPTRIGLLHILKEMGAQIEITNRRFFGNEPVADLQVRYSELHGIDIPAAWVSLAIDEFPAILIACALAKGKTRLEGAEELRFKESDRIASMVNGLNQLNIEATQTPDGLVLEGGVLQGGTVDSQHDHRIAMAFLMAGALAKAPVTVQHCGQITTSFPLFLDKAREIHLNIRTYDNEF